MHIVLACFTIGLASGIYPLEAQNGQASTKSGGGPMTVKKGGANSNDPSASRRALRFSYGQRTGGRPLLANPQVMSVYNSGMVKAIDWITENQGKAGHWPESKPRVADTGLAVLCLLSYGVLPQDKTKYGQATKNGLDWLTKQVNSKGDMRDSGRMYSQAIGTLALAEAYNLTKSKKLEVPLKLAVNFLVQSQNPITGGWRYTPYQTKQDPGDLSVTGWVIMALQSASYSSPLVSKQTQAKMKLFLDMVSAGKNKGLYGYTKGRIKPSTTAIGMYCQQLVGKTSPSRQNESADLLLQNTPTNLHNHHAVGCGQYHYWFYATSALFIHGGKDWEDWEDKLMTPLLKFQNPDGSWDPVGPQAKPTGKVIATCWATMCLSIYNQVLPITNLNKPGSESGNGNPRQLNGSKKTIIGPQE